MSRAQNESCTIIEVYPGAAKKSAAFQDLAIPHGLKMASVGTGDEADALRCAMTAYCYAATVGLIDAATPKVHLPTESTASNIEIKSEGWIFTPTF